jgi:CheY-like chemotaxis protein
VSERRLLLVDDDDDIRAVATLSLEHVGDWTVVNASSGAGALKAVAEQGPFEVVLLDVMMPDLDGPGTLAQLRAGPLPDDVPVVFLTARVESSERERLSSIGAAGVLAKPFDPLRLPEELDAVLAGA